MSTPSPTFGYLLKIFPRFSETFVINEVRELERRGMRLHLFSLKPPPPGPPQSIAAEVRAPQALIPEGARLLARALLQGSPAALTAHPIRLLRTLAYVATRRRLAVWKRFGQALVLAREARREGIAHLHAHFASSPTSVALLVHKLTGIPYSFTAHAKDIYLRSKDPRLLAEKIGAARFVVTVSHANRAHLLAQAGVGAREKIAVIPNGVDLSLFAPNGRRRSGRLLLAVGRLVEKKGFGDLIEACSHLRARGISFRCLIVGEGPERERLRSAVAEAGLAPLVALAGPRDTRVVAALMREAAVLVLPALVGEDGNREGLPTVLLEALASGLPVVTTPVAGIPEIVDPGENGLLVPPRDPAALADALGRLLGDRSLRERLGRGARAKAEQAFDLPRNVLALSVLLWGSALGSLEGRRG